MSTLLCHNTEEMTLPLHAEMAAFYNDHLGLLGEVQTILSAEMDKVRRECTEVLGRNLPDHWSIRIKPVTSVQSKLQRLGYPVTAEAAVSKLHDVIGARAVCAFIDDIYFMKKWFYRQSSMAVEEEKDYIKHPKPNGYRSCHLIVRISLPDTNMLVEIQLRTLAMDCWAALEHQLKYKNEKMMQEFIIHELKRCSDEMASTDWNLLAIREMVEQHMGLDEHGPYREGG